MSASTSTSSAIKLASLENVSLSLQKKSILHDVSLELQAGKVLTIIGPNGAGKSTIVRLLLGLEKADKGTVWQKPNLRIGYVPQKMHINSLMPLTVKRFVALSGVSDNTEISTVLNEMGVAQLENQAIQQLSGGEFQHVLLARALLRKPELLVLDEPAQGVDVIGQAELYEKISQLKDSYGFGVLMVSHDLHLVMKNTDQVLCLNQHICCSGQPDDVSQHPEYQKLFGNLPMEGLAVYTHNHNHCHDLHGDVVEGDCNHEHHEQENHRKNSEGNHNHG
jgi:zinc transport system ATP-binding protein